MPAAKRKPRARQSKQRGRDLSSIFKPETIGAVLVVLALLTLLSLLTAQRSTGIGVFIDILRLFFGIGVWLVPAVFGALGLWLVLRQIADQQVLSGRRIAGGLLLFAAFEGVAHLILSGSQWNPWLPEQIRVRGGLVGWLIGQLFVPILDVPVSVAALVLVGLVALFIISGLTVGQLQEGVQALARRLQRSESGPERVPFNPPLPFDESEPFWQRLRARFFSPRDSADPLPDFSRPPLQIGQPAPVRQIGAPPQSVSAAPAPRPRPERQPAAAVPANSAQPTPAPAPAAKDASHITAGSGQTWRIPALDEILEDVNEQDIKSDDLRLRAQIIEKTLEGFGIPVQVVEANQGPAITQFGLRPGVIVRRNKKGEEKRIKVRVSQIQALSNDLALVLSAPRLRIEAPVPGRDVVGVEVPNVQISMVSLRGVMESDEFQATRGPLIFGLGRDVSGQAAVADMARMPHLLIAGATGSGKSVCVNAIITSLLLTHTPETLRFLMIDPKRVELTVYNGIPHLIAPVVVDVERAVPVLQWATKEMERRYTLFSKVSARNIESYNEKLVARGEPALPYIMILIDELADLMLSAPEDVERYICRLAQMARATGMHLVIATQRPSVDVVTGLIKANFPARIAFAVTSQIDSRVILDTPGAEQLLGRGDMLFMAPDASKLHRLQGCYVSDRETQRLVNYWRGVHAANPQDQDEDLLAGEGDEGEPGEAAQADGAAEPPWLPGQEALQQPLWEEMGAKEDEASDAMYAQAVEEVRQAGRASVSFLQRRLRIGYSRAARLIDELEANGVIGPDLGGSRGREVLEAAEDEDPE